MGTLLAVVGVIYYFVFGLLIVHYDWDVNTFLFILGYVVLAVIIVIVTKSISEKCPKCGKGLAMKEISRKVAKTFETTMDVERQVKSNTTGKVIRTYTESVPATKFIYDCVDRCKFCGHTQNVKRENIVRK